MSKDLTSAERLTMFVQTVTDERRIEATDVTDNGQATLIAANLAALQNVNAALANPDKLRENITHALPNKVRTEDPVVTITVDTQRLMDILKMSGKELFEHLFTAEYLADLNISSDSFQYDDALGVATLTISEDKPLRLKKALINFEILQSALSDPDIISNILLDNAPAIKDDGETSPFGKSTLGIYTRSATEARIVFNYGFLREEIQYQVGGNGLTAPVLTCIPNDNGEIVAADGSIRVTLNQQHLLKFIRDSIDSGLVFREEAPDQLRPIAFEPADPDHQVDKKHLFHINLDRSGSMRDGFDQYQDKVIEVITWLAKNTKPVTSSLVITAFNDQLSTQTFDLDEAHLPAITGFVRGLTADGRTNLHGVLSRSMSSILAEQGGYDGSTLIVMTDGCHEDPTVQITEQQVVDQALVARSSSEQFSMYSLGFGNAYNAKFFTEMASRGGFTHLHLKSVAEIKQMFGQHLANLTSSKVVYEFLRKAQHFFKDELRLQVAAGTIAILDDYVSRDNSVRFRGEVHRIGRAVAAHASAAREEELEMVSGGGAAAAAAADTSSPAAAAGIWESRIARPRPSTLTTSTSAPDIRERHQPVSPVENVLSRRRGSTGDLSARATLEKERAAGADVSIAI